MVALEYNLLFEFFRLKSVFTDMPELLLMYYSSGNVSLDDGMLKNVLPFTSSLNIIP